MFELVFRRRAMEKTMLRQQEYEGYLDYPESAYDAPLPA